MQEKTPITRARGENQLAAKERRGYNVEVSTPEPLPEEEKEAEAGERIPFLDQVAEEIKEKGSFQRELDGPELADMMSPILQSLAEDKGIKLEIQNIELQIEGQRGTLKGSVYAEQGPFSLTFDVGLPLLMTKFQIG